MRQSRDPAANDPAADAALRRWVSTWTAAGDALDAVRRKELACLDTQSALAQLADAFDHALTSTESRRNSGLVVQQQLFALLRR